MIDEELILSALGNLMAQVRWTHTTTDDSQFITFSRRVKLFSDVPSQDQPACFQAEWATEEQQVTGLPYKTSLLINWIVFQCVGKDKDAVGAIENNLILGGVRKALAPVPQDPGFFERRNTLGGLVHHCFISGRVFKDPGDIDDQGMMVIPIKLLVP